MKLLKQAAHTVFFKLATMAARVLLMVLLGQALTPEDMGAYALVNTTLTIGIYLVGLSLFQYVYRTVPGEELGLRARVLKTTWLFEVGLASSLCLLTVYTGAMHAFLKTLKATAYADTFALGLLLLVVQLAAAELQHYLLGRTRIEENNWLDFLSQAAWVFPLWLMWKPEAVMDVNLVLWAQIVGTLLAVLYGFSRIEWRDWLTARFDGGILQKAIVFSLPLIVPSLSFYALKLADRYILAWLDVSLYDIGLYSFAITFLNTLYSLTANVVFTTVLPYSIEAHNQEDYPHRDRVLALTLKAATVSYLLGAAFLIAFSKPILELVARPEYQASAPIMPWVAAGFVMMILAYPAQYILMLENRTRLIMVSDLLGLAVGIGLNLWLIPRYSYWGAAYSTAISFALVAVLKNVLAQSWRFLHPRDFLSFRPELEWLRRKRS